MYKSLRHLHLLGMLLLFLNTMPAAYSCEPELDSIPIVLSGTSSANIYDILTSKHELPSEMSWQKSYLVLPTPSQELLPPLEASETEEEATPPATQVSPMEAFTQAPPHFLKLTVVWQYEKYNQPNYEAKKKRKLTVEDGKKEMEEISNHLSTEQLSYLPLLTSYKTADELATYFHQALLTKLVGYSQPSKDKSMRLLESSFRQIGETIGETWGRTPLQKNYLSSLDQVDNPINAYAQQATDYKQQLIDYEEKASQVLLAPTTTPTCVYEQRFALPTPGIFSIKLFKESYTHPPLPDMQSLPEPIALLPQTLERDISSRMTDWITSLKDKVKPHLYR